MMSVAMLMGRVCADGEDAVRRSVSAAAEFADRALRAFPGCDWIPIIHCISIWHGIIF